MAQPSWHELDPKSRLKVGHHIYKTIEQAGFIKVSTRHVAEWIQRHLLGPYPGVAVFDSQFSHPLSRIDRNAIFVAPGDTRIPGEDTKVTDITRAELVYYWDLAEFHGFPKYYTSRLTVARRHQPDARRANEPTHEVSLLGVLKTNPRLTRLDLLLDPPANRVEFAAVTYYMTDPRLTKNGKPHQLKFTIGFDQNRTIDFRVWDNVLNPTIGAWRQPHHLERTSWEITNNSGVINFGTRHQSSLPTNNFSLRLPYDTLRPLPISANPYAASR